jgi:hypothetical protein
MIKHIDLRATRPVGGGGLADLQAYLSQLEGQPFLFAQMMYANELSLHFGSTQEFQSAKLRHEMRGTYILTTRASTWRLLSMPGGCIVSSESQSTEEDISDANRDAQLLERAFRIAEGAHVVFARIVTGAAFSNGYGLDIEFSDGSTFRIIPAPQAPADEADGLPAIADWELFTPHHRVLLIGPGYVWEYADSEAAPDVSKSA